MIRLASPFLIPSCVLIVIAALIPAPATASAETAPDSLGSPADTTEKTYWVEEISVTASRTETRVIESPREIRIVDAIELRDSLTPGTPEALVELPEVLIQKTSLGGGAPIVRGLSGNRILLLVDGVRLNNSTYRIGLNQYLNTVDPGIVDRIEVVPGAGSVLYGSDALGGVIHVMTPAPAENLPRLSYSGNLTAAEGSHTHAVRTSRWWGSGGLIAGVGYRDFNDVRAGGGIGIQKPTAYSEWSANARALFLTGQRAHLSIGYQITRQNDVPRTDRVVAGKDSLYVYDPQHRELFFARYEAKQISDVIQFASVSLSWNHQREGRTIITNSRSDVREEFLDDVQTMRLVAEARSLAGERTLLTYGGETYLDFVSSRGKDVNLADASETSTSGKFPDDGQHLSAGLFAQATHTLTNVTTMVGAVRFSTFRLTGTPLGDFGKVSLTNSMLTGSAQARFSFGEDDHLFAGISQAFRSPNMEDALAAGLSNKGYDVPNPNLDAERSWSFEAGLKTAGRIGGNGWPNHESAQGIYRLGITAYLTLISDLIERTPTTFAGSDSLNGSPVFHNENLGSARIVGISGSGDVHPFPTVRLRSSISWTRGTNSDLDQPMTRIPPLRGRVALRHDFSDGWIELPLVWATAQKRLSPEDIRDTRILDGGTPGYATVHLRGGMPLGNGIEFRASLENIADSGYRTHGSGIDQPGRNLIVGLDWSLP